MVRGSLAHYFSEMSDGALNLVSADNDDPIRWYDGTAEPNMPTPPGCTRNVWGNAVSAFVRAVLTDPYTNRAKDNVDFTGIDSFYLPKWRSAKSKYCSQSHSARSWPPLWMW